ncbi:MAG: NFYB/HAP3 family transcription factor subunit [Candidatus Aenigmatarchaeota archaeon]
MVKDFPLLAIEKVAKKAGKEVGADRVSLEAVKELKNYLLEVADKIASDAVTVAHHAKRVTVKREDIILVTRK